MKSCLKINPTFFLAFLLLFLVACTGRAQSPMLNLVFLGDSPAEGVPHLALASTAFAGIGSDNAVYLGGTVTAKTCEEGLFVLPAPRTRSLVRVPARALEVWIEQRTTPAEVR